MVGYQEIFSELKIWEERFSDSLWRIAVAIRDGAIAMGRTNSDFGIYLPERSENDDDGNGVTFRWDHPCASGGPDFIWVEVRLVCGRLHGDEDGYNIVVEAGSPAGTFYTRVPDNYTSRVWKTGWGDLEDTVTELLDSRNGIAWAIREAAGKIGASE